MRAFVPAHVDRGYRIEVLVIRNHLCVAISRRLYQLRIRFHRPGSLLVPVDVVSGQIALCVGRPYQINKYVLTWTREDRLEASGRGRRKYIMRNNSDGGRIVSLDLLLAVCLRDMRDDRRA